MIKKIVIIGPESTGKSTLAEQLAERYQTVWVPEYAREYLTKHGMSYKYEDLLAIAKGQLDLEDALEKKASNGLMFIDTDMTVMKVWSDFVFGRSHPFILEQLKQRSYHLYLLCNTDLPWVEDELREYPDLETRERLMKIYRDLMKSQEVPFVEISGSEEKRLEMGMQAVESITGVKANAK